jgi:hypothetical protein
MHYRGAAISQATPGRRGSREVRAARVGVHVPGRSLRTLNLTGSLEVARQIGRAAAGPLKPLTLELGGKSGTSWPPKPHARAHWSTRR